MSNLHQNVRASLSLMKVAKGGWRCNRRALHALEKPYYVTSPIFYVNAGPHVGHLYTLVLADVLKRWALLKGHQRAVLLTGTDEHGMKIQKAAQSAKQDTKLLCDQTMKHFDHLARKGDISYDRFIRTTDPDHKKAVEHFWQELNHRGFLYESKHEGWYSVSDETFFPTSAVHLIRDPATGNNLMVSIETGHQVEWTSEMNYHFRLSAFRDRLLEHYAQNPQFIVPGTRTKNVVEEVKRGLQDLSVSRPAERLTWGIRVPNDDSQTIYVWLDALINYLTKAGYPFDDGEGKGTEWPPNVHVVGKDIMKFHCIYWPAFLLALDLPLPRQILAHGHWTMNGAKMSKSARNGVNPFFAIDRFGVDTMRFFMIYQGKPADDVDYDNAFVIERYKKYLQSMIGNLVSRVMRSKRWSVYDCIQFGGHPDHLTEALGSEHRAGLVRLPAQVDSCFTVLNPRQGLHQIMSALLEINRLIVFHEVWRTAKDPSEHGQRETKIMIYLAAETMRICGILLQPFMPSKMKQLLDMLGVDDEKRLYVHAKFGTDLDYGNPRCDVGRHADDSLFPPLTSEW